MVRAGGKSLGVLLGSIVLLASACGSVTSSSDSEPAGVVFAGDGVTPTESQPASEVAALDGAQGTEPASSAPGLVSTTTISSSTEDGPTVPQFAPPDTVPIDQSDKKQGVRLCAATELVMTRGDVEQLPADASGNRNVRIYFEFRNESDSVCKRPLKTTIVVYDPTGKQVWAQSMLISCSLARECLLLNPGELVGAQADWDQTVFDVRTETSEAIPSGNYSAEAVLSAERSVTADLSPASPGPDGTYEKREYRSQAQISFEIVGLQG
ncbi:MAG: hypothetical protein ACC652_04005 [Acidimicrobiales bacterium]